MTVQSNKPWTGTIDGSDGTPTSDVTVALGSFRYDTNTTPTSYTECGTDTAVPSTPTLWEGAGLIGANQLYTHSHCVLVDWDDADGTIGSTITRTVQQ